MLRISKKKPDRVKFNITIPKCDNVFQAIGYVMLEQNNNALITPQAFRDFQDDVMSNGLRILPSWGVYCQE